MEKEEGHSLQSDEDDPVIKEIPIFLSKRLQDNLFILQHPMSPSTYKHEHTVQKVFISPENRDLKLDISLNVESPNFDPAKAEDIVRDIETNPKKQKNKDLEFENDLMDRLLLQSHNSVKDPSNHAVGCFNGKEFHITPLKGLLHMRPVFNYLDKSGKRKKEVQAVEDDDEEEAGPSIKQVTVKFGKADNVKNIITKEDKPETWVECTWNDEKSTLSQIQKQKLFAAASEDHNQASSLTALEYIRTLVPEDLEEDSKISQMPVNRTTLQSMRRLPLLEQCKIALINAKIIQFQQLVHLLSGSDGVTAEAILKFLPQVAVLVRGTWVVKSELVYPKDSLSSISGVSADVMCQARDYVLYLFTQNQFVYRKKVESMICIPAVELKEIFKGIARLKPNKAWELAAPTDTEFLLKHVDIVQRQTVQWDQRVKQIVEILNKDGREKRQRRKSKSVSEDKEREKDSRKREYVSSDNDSGTEKTKSPVAKRAKTMKMNGEITVAT